MTKNNNDLSSADAQLEHDIKAHISTLQLAINMVRDDWKKNPESVSRVIDLSIDKLNEIKSLLKN